MKNIKYIAATLAICLIPLTITGCSDGRNGDNLTNNLGRASNGYGGYNNNSSYSDYLNNNSGYNSNRVNDGTNNGAYSGTNGGTYNGDYGNSTGMTTEYNGSGYSSNINGTMPFNY